MTRNILSIPLSFFFLLACFSCKKKPDLMVPERLPNYISFLPFEEHRHIVPNNSQVFLMGPATPVQVLPGTYNEIYSVTRHDPTIGDSITLYWNRELNYLSCINPFTGIYDSVYCPLKTGELVSIYRFQCNMGRADVEAERSSMSEIIIQVVDGVPTIIGEQTPTVEPLAAKSCTCLVAFAHYKGDYIYQVTSIVDTKDDVPESDEKNTFFEPDIENLRAN